MPNLVKLVHFPRARSTKSALKLNFKWAYLSYLDSILGDFGSNLKPQKSTF
ncbi:hypothetical protein HYC85_029335 [Camellia sinensis]|uniref:Uncharacterized protein n=1 Tax=Camellia sinensis TaxID=4442 RepID=A0A7J7G1M7_CAMSI|nr:hypothetical protein HYC85_029335 [Camellia sinensis]